MTVSEYLEYCVGELDRAGLCFGHGTDNPGDEAAWLVSASLGIPVQALAGVAGAELEGPVLRHAEKLLRARIETRQPLAYLLGEAWFCGLRFEVNADVLVPRSPFAELIADRFHPWVDVRQVKRALDLCTGSGCIAIALAKHAPWMQVDASDISPAALALAERNRRLHGLETRVALVQSDLFEALANRRYELIVSNPPYVARRTYEDLPPEYLAEPALGLISPGQGLELPLRILARAPEHLAPGGQLFCEVGVSAGALERLLPDLPATWLQFKHGGDGVFTIGRDELLQHRPAVVRALENLNDVL